MRDEGGGVARSIGRAALPAGRGRRAPRRPTGLHRPSRRSPDRGWRDRLRPSWRTRRSSSPDPRSADAEPRRVRTRPGVWSPCQRSTATRAKADPRDPPALERPGGLTVQAVGGAQPRPEPARGGARPGVAVALRAVRRGRRRPFLADYSGGRPVLAASAGSRAREGSPRSEGLSSFTFDSRQPSALTGSRPRVRRLLGRDGASRSATRGPPGTARTRRVLEGAFGEGDPGDASHRPLGRSCASRARGWWSSGPRAGRPHGISSGARCLRATWARPGRRRRRSARSRIFRAGSARAGRNEPWTVIIAGGDLVVRGKIDVDTSLLVWAADQALASPDRARQPVPQGGGFDLRHHADLTAMPVLDSPSPSIRSWSTGSGRR